MRSGHHLRQRVGKKIVHRLQVSALQGSSSGWGSLPGCDSSWPNSKHQPGLCPMLEAAHVQLLLYAVCVCR